MDLVHDALDAQLIDRHGAKLGRIDSIVVALVDGEPPVVVAIECGPVPLAARLHPRIAAGVARWLRRRGSVLATPYRIAWSALARAGNDWRVDVVAADTPASASERWLRERFVGRIPGA